MITRMSQLFLRTLREDPADAEVPSHKLLVRAGYIRRTAPGVYSWLPLGLKVLRNVEKVVREEMEGIGAQELAFPALLPREPYEATNRWTEYGPELFRLKDRKGADYLLGPTHEEMFALAVKDLFSSYKDFPTTLFQIQTKYRDEARPRAGILRGREFVMKDSYSFDMDDEGLENSYQQHRGAYQRIFDRLGIKYEICHATSGAMGGSASEEFLAVSESGEDSFVVSTDGEYAANVEAVKIPAVEPQPIEGQPEAKVYESPNCTTIAALVDWANGADLGREVTAADTLKCVLVAVDPKKVDKESNALPEQLTAILVPGDREVDEKRLEVAFEPGEARLLEDKDFAANDFLIKGYVGPQGLADRGVKVLADPRVAEGTNWITGANEEGKHIVDVVAGRDFQIDGICDVAEVRDGDPAPEGHGTLKIERGIEIGHIFQLGRKYTNAFEIDILDVNGKRARPTMGSYGIGVSRLVAVLAEQQLDEKGLKWPVAAAPYKVHIAVAGKNAEAAEAAEQLAEDLSQQGIEVLFDDRPKVSPGVKFKDAELLGMPFVVIFGRGYADGKVELRNRLTNETDEVAADGIAAHVAELVRKA
ncbi:proline--tRNA ligase [Corynebacterium sp. LK22]|uniref:proline--tRNA ligase n=1 Tax=Corynebacterium TaxID=1716 RepID=UPI0008A5CB11|nr:MULTISPECIES: proline--tRNA ligase [unclassified Corynebacterium]MBC6764053.1 proline--tRNA ligase [Corynebacterium sp. LK22]OFU60511.1 proline--tRNA ligase [Corynebacterium sp. HMSC14H10]OHR24728.1 proline--tRNA ligase [Corynebacterium sp. HMSC072B09]OHR28136.1 proline--tRNA ligase [Corynebacterium sp. HMSC073B01]